MSRKIGHEVEIAALLYIIDEMKYFLLKVG